MAKQKTPALQIETYPTYHVITQPNPLSKVLRRSDDKDHDDPIARAEQALAGLSGEFRNWMETETKRLLAAHAGVVKKGFTNETREELFRAAHDIKGDAVTFGYPDAAAIAESLCRIIEHAPDLRKVPPDLIEHHVNAIQAIVHENTKLDTISVSSELSHRLRKVADDYLARINHDRPDHLDAVLAPSIVPGD